MYAIHGWSGPLLTAFLRMMADQGHFAWVTCPRSNVLLLQDLHGLQHGTIMPRSRSVLRVYFLRLVVRMVKQAAEEFLMCFFGGWFSWFILT